MEVDRGLFEDDHAALAFAVERNAALCTIVGIDGSFSRRLGAQLAVGADGSVVGSMADGCLEAELVNQVAIARHSGQPALLRYGRGSPFIDFRLPCGSGLDILVDPFPARGDLSRALRTLELRRPACVPLPVSRSDLLASRTYLPKLRLAILGDSAEAASLDRLARAFGFGCCYKPTESRSWRDWSPLGTVDAWTAVTLLFHDHEWECDILEQALPGPAFYVGAIGGRTTRANRTAALLGQGLSEHDMERLRSPIGLIPSARDAATLALGVLAEIVGEYEKLLCRENLRSGDAVAAQ